MIEESNPNANAALVRTALICYWGSILLLGVMLYASWGRATQAMLVDEDVTIEMQAAICGGSSSRSPCMPWARHFAFSARMSASV